MCGIFGYIGSSGKAPSIVFEGLKSLEYRGYDSWGVIASVESPEPRVKGKLLVEKHTGKIGTSALGLKIQNLESNLALGHTRWATHGGVTTINAHPHPDCNGEIALVHNGIVENWSELKDDLLKKGHKFVSETDSEVVVHLVEEFCNKVSFFEAVRKAFMEVSGLNAFVFVRDGEMIAVKSGTPLVVGLGEDGNFIASDPAALLAHTRKVIFVGDSQIVEIKKDKVAVFELSGKKEIRPRIENLTWKAQEASLGEFDHYMLKEIYEQPKVLRAIAANGEQVGGVARKIGKAKETFFVACGSASYAALSGKYLFSKIAKKHVNYSIGSEFNYIEDYINKNWLVIPVSQSGESVDVIEPVNRAKGKGAKVVALVNVLGSTLYRISDFNLLLGAGPEKAVCATKSWTAMVANMVYLAYELAGDGKMGRKIVEDAARGVEKVLTKEYLKKIKALAKVLAKRKDIFIIGRGLSYATALEATLKLKEVPYIHSEGFAGGELKHGVIALIEKGTPCIVFAPNDETYEAVISNAIEIKSRGGYIIGISPKNNKAFDYYLSATDAKEASIITGIVPIQLLAYYIALVKGLDPDMPRNLAKSVTVR